MEEERWHLAARRSLGGFLAWEGLAEDGEALGWQKGEWEEKGLDTG